MKSPFYTEKRCAEISRMTIEERLTEGQRISEEAIRLVRLGVEAGLVEEWVLEDDDCDALAQALREQRAAAPRAVLS